jgi:hypothetical protein
MEDWEKYEVSNRRPGIDVFLREKQGERAKNKIRREEEILQNP